MKKIWLGRTVMTRSICSLIQDEKISQAQVNSLAIKQMNCQWGETTGSDARMNDEAAKTLQGRVLASHTINDIKIWVITDFAGKNTVTTILLPEDY